LGLQFAGRASAVRFALPAPSIREASLSGSQGGLLRRLLWFAPPLVSLAATALYLYAGWNSIPEKFPIHFDLNGDPNGWSHRTFSGVFGPLILAALIVVYLMLLYLAMDLCSRRSTQRTVMLAALAAPCYLVGAMACLAGLLPFFVPPARVFLVLVVGFFAAFIALMARVLALPSDGPREVTPDRCWRGVFYYNPDDPALFVEARAGGFGYTANLARPCSWLLMALALLFAAGLFLFARRLLG
jgi:uncharacterized membrane protein